MSGRFRMPASAPARFPSSPSKSQVTPSAVTTNQCHRLHGSRSSRAGMLVVISFGADPAFAIAAGWTQRVRRQPRPETSHRAELGARAQLPDDPRLGVADRGASLASSRHIWGHASRTPPNAARAERLVSIARDPWRRALVQFLETQRVVMADKKSVKSANPLSGGASSGAKSSARSTVGAPAHDDGRGRGDAATARMRGTEAVAASMPFNANKATEYGEASANPRPARCRSRPTPA